MVLAAAGQRTRRIRLGTAVALLPLHNPVKIIEEAATADILSDGRLEFGVGRGAFPLYYVGFDVPQVESRERFEEAVAAFHAALKESRREPAQLQWAMIQTNLGTALRALGEREKGTTRLEEAIAAYESALRVFVSAGSDRYVEICRTGRDLSLALLNHRRR